MKLAVHLQHENNRDQLLLSAIREFRKVVKMSEGLLILVPWKMGYVGP